MDFQEYMKTINIINPSIINIKKGDVNGDLIIDTVFLIGRKEINSPLVKDITIIIQDGKTKKFFNINLKNNMGYNPSISLVRFNNNNYDDILISINSGGSGSFEFYYVYNFFKNNPSLLFDSDEFNSRYQYNIIYNDNYKVVIQNQTLRNTFTIDISNRPKSYLDEIYNEDGTLKEPISGFITGLSALFPVDFDRDNIFNLIGIQRISGRYAADSLGYLETELFLTQGGFYPVNNEQRFSILSTKY